MRLADVVLSVAVAAAGAHVLCSMQLPTAAVVMGVLSALALLVRLQPRLPLAPTPGLAFIVFVSGGLLGYLGLADLVPAGSWAGDFAVFAGLCLAGLVLMLWLLATRLPPLAGSAGDNGGDILAASTLALVLLIPRNVPADGLTLTLPWLGAGAGFLAPALSRLGVRVLPRILILLPALMLLPLTEPALQAAQRPLIGALISAMPNPRGETAFSPLAQLRPDGFLRPARRPVMRLAVTGGTPPQYLVGNRLLTLGAGLEWKTDGASGPELLSVATESGRRYRLGSGPNTWSLAVHSLRRDDLVFVPPGTRQVDMVDSSLAYDRTGVLRAQFADRAARRWQLAGGTSASESRAGAAALALPAFWDAELQAAAGQLAGADATQTAARVAGELRGRQYSLRFALNRDAPFKDFFLKRKPAHCFWYATASVLALRANGVPSRLVTGYLVTEPLSESLWLVRERDAHAWSEWQDEAGRWHTLDATPPDYDLVLADFGGGELERAWQRLLANLDLWWRAIQLTDGQVQGVLLAGLAVLAGLFVREYRRLRRTGPRALRGREWARLWRQFLRASGLPERPQWTAGDYLEHLPTSWSSTRHAAARHFLEMYSAGRFAPDGTVAGAGAALKQFRRRRLSA